MHTLASRLPERIRSLADIAQNLWWSWQTDARDLFRKVDPRLWEGSRHNPVEVLRLVPEARLQRWSEDPEFLALYDAVAARFAALRDPGNTWFARQWPELVQSTIAYFSAEFAFHRSIPVYSGGLGVLAGDLCKEASDLGVPLIGVGLLYRQGYLDQRVGVDGWQTDSDDRLDIALTPLTRVTTPQGDPALTSIQSMGRELFIGAWRVAVGRVPVYLLDTDLESNHLEDRQLSGRLYSGATEWRLRQEWLLGVGGVRVVRALGYEPTVWHANEGHASFMYLERMRELVARGTPSDQIEPEIRRHGVFTTHTPVAAGHDAFSAEELELVAGPLYEPLGISRERLMTLGNAAADPRFHMTALGLRLAGRVNAVSARHGEVSRAIWQGVPIRHVTNGVHLGTWMGQPMRALLAEHLGAGWEDQVEDPAVWDKVLTLDDGRLWAAHESLRQALHTYIREEARARWRDHWKNPAKLAGVGALLSPNVLTIGFARRFATYKRADLVLRDPERLRKLLTSARRPVQIVFAGKAHPSDEPGKQVLQKVYLAAQDPAFEGRIAFLEAYDLHLAHRMVQGVDLWMNLPRVPLEASGTSGMKAALNAVPQLSTLDGWWAEGYNGENGWAIPAAPADGDADAWDLDQLFRLLEDEVVPRYYHRARGHVSPAWARVMRQALWVGGRGFTSRRMLKEYVTDYYVPAMQREPA